MNRIRSWSAPFHSLSWGRTSLVVIASVGAGLSLTFFATLRAEHLRLVKHDFERAAVERGRVIEEVFADCVDLVAATAAHMELGAPHDRESFARFARSILERQPGTPTLGWIPRVGESERADFERTARAELGTFQLTQLSGEGSLAPARGREEYFPVVYIEPLAGNERAVGFDLASDSVRRRALEQARRTGKAVATARLRLVQETGNRFSLLLVHPVHRTTGSAQGGELTGFASLVVRIDAVVGHALGMLAPGGIDLALYDESASADQALLHLHPSRLRDDHGAGSLVTAPRPAHLTASLRFEVAGRVLSVTGTPAPGRFSLATPGWTWSLLAAGLAFTALLVAYLELLRRQAERLEAERERLEHRVAERTSELQRVHSDLLVQERLATLGKLTGTVAHEIRNPLSTLYASIQQLTLLLDDQGTGVGRALERSQRSIQRCDRIITELLDFTRARGPDPQLTRVDEWITQLVEEYEAPEGVDILLDMGAEGRTVMLDGDLMRRAMINVLDNAAQAFGADDRTKGAIRVSTRLDGSWLRIEVADDGPGIPLDLLQQVCEPLFSTKSFGIGLGLPTVRRIMEQHGGSFGIANHPASGALAVLSLPAPGTGP